MIGILPKMGMYSEPRFSAFVDWTEQNSGLMPFLTIQRPSCVSDGAASIHLFLQHRRSVHHLGIANLTALCQRLDAEIHCLAREQAHTTPGRRRRVTGLIFDKQKHNLLVRVSAFVEQKIEHLFARHVALRMALLGKKRSQAVALLELLSGEVTPIVTITDSFFNLPIGDRYQDQVSRLKRFRERVVAMLNGLPKPHWAFDFDEFFAALIQQGVEQMSPEFFYFPPLPQEVSLTRFLFRTPSRQGSAIDNFVARATANEFANFASTIVPFCIGMLLPKTDPAETAQTAGFLLYYRAVMDCVFQAHFRPGSDYREVRKVLVRRTIAMIGCPDDIKPCGEPDCDWETAFTRDPRFLEAVKSMTAVAFAINPVDACWMLNQGLCDLHHASFANRLGREPTVDELKRTMAFDDQFCLLIGTVVVSDLPDIYRLADELKKFMPQVCLSQLLDYAAANIEALAQFCRQVGDQ
jgi:hypothetical protein